MNAKTLTEEIEETGNIEAELIKVLDVFGRLREVDFDESGKTRVPRGKPFKKSREPTNSGHI